MSGTISYILRSDGQEFRHAFKVKSIMVLNEANRIPRAKIRLLDGDVSRQDFELSNLDFFKPGKTLEIDLGHDGQSNNVFKGIILKHALKVGESNLSYLEIECKHPAVGLTINRKSRFFIEMTDQEALNEVLGASGLDFQVDGLDQFIHQQLVQYNCTNWDFILSRVDVNGSLVYFEQEKMLVRGPSMDGDEVLTCEYGVNVLGFEALMDAEDQFNEVESKSWDPANQEIITAEGSSTFNCEIGNVEATDLADAIGDEPFGLQHTGNIDSEELTHWASARSNKIELAKIRGQVTIRGDHSLFPGMIIRLSGFGDRFTGKAFITGVRHEMNSGNWTTSIQFGLPTDWFSQQKEVHSPLSSGLLPAVSGFQIGVITQLESDPGNEFRVKVRIPIVDGDEGGVWARLLKSYAGDNYGVHFYPELDDEVIVGFLNNDPRLPVVVGALHSSAKEPPIVPEDSNFEKGFVTQSQLKVLFNDDQKSIAVSTPEGREVVMDDQNSTIKISDPFGNYIEFTSEGITIESINNLVIKAPNNIDLKGLNITSKANGKFAAEGSSGAEMKTSSIAVVKGSLVQIN